ncbi:S-adenosyl-L-methionine-dependent methyltransferase [Cercophora samala]|uniref:S-adenosyl-L-methionine-dependent methyltransferase n=1 Tax=Cercophora samala TaxID=330535 RepID=A0AA39ZCE6_9PEZI|nr:S-adenosyl-L-methionine-dependent methyltransferase [Cercophora samala]
MASPTQYDPIATQYTSYTTVPDMQLEISLVRTALTPCASLTVLDLGGGSGLHARTAVELGASRVDVVDISPEMLLAGQNIEQSLHRSPGNNNNSPPVIRYIHADATKPLSPQGINQKYDVVMANWLLDHATSLDDLRAMWGNIASALKPGGRFVGVRVRCLRAGYLTQGKYGVVFSDYEPIPGPGWRYKVSFQLDGVPVTFEATSMEATLGLDHAIPEGLGLGGWEVVPLGEDPVVRGDGEYWADHVREPSFVVVVGRKLSES